MSINFFSLIKKLDKIVPVQNKLCNSTKTTGFLSSGYDSQKTVPGERESFVCYCSSLVDILGRGDMEPVIL